MADRDFQQLLDLLGKTTAEIDKLEKKFESLRQTTEKKFGAKDLGTDQVQRLNQQLADVLAKVSELKSLRASLLNEKALAEEANKVNTIVKSIDTLQRKLDELRQKQTAAQNLTGPRIGFENDPNYYAREIKRLEAALRSAENRLFNRTGAGQVQSERLSAVGSRQGAFQGSNIDLFRRERVAEVESLGRDAARRMINQIQNEILEGAIKAREIVNRPISAGLKNATERYLRGYTLPDEAASRRESGATSYIPTPAGGLRTQEAIILEDEKAKAAARLNSSVRMTEAQNRYADALAREVAVKERDRFTRLRTDYVKGLPKDEFEELGTVSAQREAEEKAALDSVRHKIQTEKRYASVLEQVTRQGYNLDDLKFARSKGTGGIEEFRFARRDQYGVNQQLDLFNTPAGRTTAGISNQFRTFGQGVVRDIGELTKWSIALAAVYGPLRKLQELTQIMIENQTRLAEATITVNSSFLDQQGIFDIAASSAEQAGESISGVIDAFTQAYRATGGAGDQVQRLADAQELLNNSLILSKLSTLDQASAIDTLSAALRQANGNLTGGTELLDSWVRVTKIANVDLASLATGFAVLGDAAEAAQIAPDELNGILAALAETGVASGRELANTARAIVAGFQSDQAREALENIGVAFADSTGKARPFLDIMKEISDLRLSGVIDETAFSKLTLALGGGTRRQAAYATFIENFSRVGEVARESARASGDAQAALARQLETVQTSLTRLGNAFQELAQTLGTEGGFLGIITSGVDGMTALVKSFDSLTSVLGKATPALAAFIATSLILKQRGQGGIQQALFGAGQGLQPDVELQRLNQISGVTPTRDRFRQSLGTNVLGTNAASGIFQGIAASVIPALLNATNKQDRFGETKAVANVIGGIGGGLVGSLVAGSPLIGAAVGTAIAEVFVNSTIARKTDIFGYGAPTFTEAGKPPATNEDLDAALQEAEINLYKSIGFGNEAFGRLITAGATETGETFINTINRAIETQDKQALENLFVGRAGGTSESLLKQLGLTRGDLDRAFAERRQLDVQPEYFAFSRATPEAQQQFRAAEAARLAAGGTTEDAKTAFSQLVEQNRNAFQDLILSQKDIAKEDISQRRISGDIRGAEYGRRTEAISGFDVKAVQYYTALGDEVDKLTGGTEDAARAFEILNNVIVYGSEDALPQLTSITGEIQQIINLLADPNGQARIDELFGGTEEAQARLEELRETFSTLLLDANQQALLSRISVPQVQGDVTKPLSTEDFNTVKQRAQELQDNFYEGFLQIPDDMYDALKGSWEEWAQIVEKSGDVFFEKVSEIDPQFFQQAMQQLLEENKLKSQQVSPFDIQKLDITSQQGAGLQSSINYFSRYLAQNFPQYEQKPEEFGVIFSDYVTSVLHGDNLAVKLALEKLVDINQKQLDGMYNIPEGATFWVPLTAAYYRPQNEGAGLGLPGVGGEAANTSALNENTNALRELSYAFKGDLGYAPRTPEYLAKIPKTPGFPGDRGQSREAEENRRLALGYRGDLGFSRRETTSLARTGTRDENVLQQLLTFLRQLLGPTTPGRNVPGGFDPSSRTGGGYKTLAPNAAQQVNPVVNARLDMRIDNSTQLVVDGRILASVITPYLASDLIRLEAAQGTITKRVII